MFQARVGTAGERGIFLKRIWAFLVVLSGMWILLTPSACAQAVDAALDDALTDHLADGEDVKWYSFEMSEPGAAELVVHGLQEQWDGWNSHWAVSIYRSDLQTLLAEGNAQAYNGGEYSPPARFSLPDLESGTYYIRVNTAASSRYTADSFRLELERTYRSAQPSPESKDGNPPAAAIGAEALTDRLASKDQVQWYAFEMTGPGDAVLIVTGLQDHWDGYIYHWQCAIYGSDRQSAITAANVRGYSETDGPSVLSAPGLAAGTYYVRMTSTSSSNPLMTTFITDPYQIQLLRYYSSSPAVSGTAGRIKSFQKAGDVLWSFDGTAFLKCNDGECYGALMENSRGAVVPVLISRDKQAVEYVVSGTGERVTAGSAWQYEPLGGDSWYYSACGYINSYTGKAVDRSALPMLFAETKYAKMAAEKIADQLSGVSGEDQPAEAGDPLPEAEEQLPEGTAPPPEESGLPPEEADAADAAGKEEPFDASAWVEEKQNTAALLAVGVVSLLSALCLFNALRGPSKRKRAPSTRASSSSGSGSGTYSGSSSGSYSSSGYSSYSGSGYGSYSGGSYGSYSSGGYSSSFDSSTSERTFTEGGPTGCGIGGSFCGCGSGR